MADQERMVIGYPVETSFNHQAQPNLPTASRPTTTTSSTATATATATTTNSTAMYTPRTRPFTTQNQPATNIRAATTTTTTNNNNNFKWDVDLPYYICSTMLWLIIFGATIFGIIDEVRVNHLHPLKFQVDSVTIYPFNISSSHITANWNFSFSITNPNDYFVFYYDDIWSSVFYKEKNISSTKLGSFFQDTRNKRMVQATIVASSAYVNNSVARAIVTDLSHGAVNFTVTVNATTWIDPGTAYEQEKQMTVSCEDVKVGFSLNTTAGTMLGGSRECSVSLNKLK